MHIFTGMTKITSISVQGWTHRRIHIQPGTLITTFVLKKLLAFLSCVSPQQQTCQAASYASGPCFKYLNKKSDWSVQTSTSLPSTTSDFKPTQPSQSQPQHLSQTPAFQRTETREEERKQPVWKPGIYSIQKKMLKTLLCVCVQYLLWYS